MRPVRRFEVLPAIPAALAALPELATNLHWSWDAEATRLFARLWPGLAARPRPPGRDGRAPRRPSASPSWPPTPASSTTSAPSSRRLQTALKGTTWFGRRDGSPLRSVAYFSPEFGISEALPQYSGGLGVLAGDHLKASSDLGVPLVGVGLLYTEGYFRQRLDADGWQQESVAELHPAVARRSPTPASRSTVDLAGDAGAGPRLAGRRRSHPAVPARHRRRGQLARRRRRHRPPLRRRRAPPAAPGDRARHRRRARAARARPASPTCSTPTRATPASSASSASASWSPAGCPFDAAIEAVRGGGVFTTHTPVPAGHRPLPARS